MQFDRLIANRVVVYPGSAPGSAIHQPEGALFNLQACVQSINSIPAKEQAGALRVAADDRARLHTEWRPVSSLKFRQGQQGGEGTALISVSGDFSAVDIDLDENSLL